MTTASSPSAAWLQREAKLTLTRLLPRLRSRFEAITETPEWAAFTERLDRHFGALFGALHELYGDRYDFFFHLETILVTMTEMWLERSDELKALDAAREADPHWFHARRMLGATGYVDLFAGDLSGVRAKLPYLSEMGITYLHLMPLFRSPEGDNDGGYAISSYREVDPRLGTMEELAALTPELRRHGISLVLDFVFNHTADEHEWARKALAGDPDYQAYYRMYPDRSMPDSFQRTIRSVFPDEHPGCFTYRNRIRKWVWTTFHNYQWDLNYENPTVFNAMAGEMLFLANVGVEVLRLDAVAFIWKRQGTNCENLPEAHTVIRAFNALVQIAAPAMVFKSEAIVHPDEVVKYIGANECQLSYNPMLMALLWSTLATRDVRLMHHALEKRFALTPETAWVNYIRCHDDIGWVFSDDDAAELDIDASNHRRFLNDFYTGRFEGSFARGLPFQENPETGDMRVSGTAASLCGLEKALAEGDDEALDLAIRRILLMHGVILTIGGIPLLYLGDEIGILNDYDYAEVDPERIGDSRWIHRPVFDWDAAEKRFDRDFYQGRIHAGLLRLFQIRQQNLAFARANTEIIDTGNNSVFGYFRQQDEQSVLVLANFSEQAQIISARRLRLLGLRKTVTDIASGRIIIAAQELSLEPYQLAVLLAAR
jgi:amylosucrase/maltose alpha-D-glucosyltransferase/alpha-amylase